MAVKHLVENVRDIALVGHRAAGKTSLADALLVRGPRGRSDGQRRRRTPRSPTPTTRNTNTTSPSTRTSCTPTTTANTSTFSTPPAIAGLHRRGPRSALPAVETAVVVVSADQRHRGEHAQDVQGSDQQGLSRAIVINKLDAEKVDFPGLVQSIQASFGKNCVLFNVPDTPRTRLRNGHLPARPAQDIPPELPGRCASGRARSSSTRSSRPTRR